MHNSSTEVWAMVNVTWLDAFFGVFVFLILIALMRVCDSIGRRK
jgi:hypothetical protein